MHTGMSRLGYGPGFKTHARAGGLEGVEEKRINGLDSGKGCAGSGQVKWLDVSGILM